MVNIFRYHIPCNMNVGHVLYTRVSVPRDDQHCFAAELKSINIIRGKKIKKKKRVQHCHAYVLYNRLQMICHSTTRSYSISTSLLRLCWPLPAACGDLSDGGCLRTTYGTMPSVQSDGTRTKTISPRPPQQSTSSTC